jgi:26S proteasome regulatory subunit N12
LKDAATLLFFKSQTELLEFAAQVSIPFESQSCVLKDNALQRGWQINLTEGTISFARKGEEKLEIPKDKLISNNLAYARELEQIV